MIDLPTYSEIQSFVIEQMTTNQWFQTVGFFGVLGMIWQYTRKVPEYLWERIKRKITYTANIEETDEFYSYFENWLNLNHKKSYRNVQVSTTANRTYNTYSKSYSNDDRSEEEDAKVREENLKFKQFQDLFFIWRGIFLIKVFKGREQLQNASNINNAYYNHFKISGIFGKRVINKMLQEVLELKLEEDKNRLGQTVGVWTNNGTYWQKEEDFEPKNLNNIIIPEKEDVIADIQDFLDSEDWYKSRSIPYRRGYMFYGDTGTGKTTLAIALAKYFKKDMFVLNPSGVKDDELRDLFRNLNKKSILLLEDADAVFSKNRDKKDTDIKFNFSTLLNCLDGVFSKEGVITIFTTNHPEQLDKALVREGRIDYKLAINNPTLESINKYIQMFYGTELNIDVIKDSRNVSMAKIQEICLLNKENPKKTVKDIAKLIQTEDK